MRSLTATISIILLIPASVFSQSGKTEILILGSDHLNQIYKKDNPQTDVYNSVRQKEIEEFNSLVSKYDPDMIMVESLPENQIELDSLFDQYTRNSLNIKALENGRSEIFQIAFPLAKKHRLKKIYCVNAPGGTSQSILDNGENIELYKNETIELRKIVGEKYSALQSGKLSFRDFLIFLNQPGNYNRIYHLRYITPSRVINGTFRNPDKMIDTAHVDPQYIGAELTSVFKERDYKIYSNIVTNQIRQKANRILLIIGVAHIGSLKSIFRDDQEYTIIEATKYLNK